MIWVLTMEFLNFDGGKIFIHLPAFATEQECEWWRSWLWNLFQRNGAHSLKVSTCELLGG